IFREKENDKLLTQADQGQSQSRHYGNVVDKSSLEAKNSLDRSSLGSSLINRSPSQKTSKDTYLQSLAEEEAPKATCKKEALKVFVTCLFVIIVVGVVVIWSFHEGRAKKHIGNQKETGVIRTNLGESDKLKNCIDEQTGNDLCYIFEDAPIINSESYDFENIVWQYENKYSNNIQLSDTFGDFLHKLNTIGLPIRMVQYNGEWEDSAGDFKFNTMTRNMLSHYFQGKYSTSRLLLPVNLACSYLSENFKEGASKRLFVRDIHTGALKTILYQGESCALWDSTNPATQTFLQEALGILQQSGTQEQTLYPQGLNKTFLVETAYHMQNTSVFAEIPTLVSNIDGKKCLDYIIPAALTAGLHGYPYIVTVAPSEDQVDHELYLRWLQIAVFFPGLKVTNSVFNFHEITAKMLKYLSDYRENEILPIILDKFDDIESGMPLLRPLWWVNPSDLVSFKIDSEFLLGNKTLVAPVLCHGERARDIYLPSGTWRYNQTGHLYTGQQWLHNFEVPLSNIAVFTLQSEPDLNETTKHHLKKKRKDCNFLI
ncbi:MYORG-like protein, partial [Mya arenaria]